MINILNAYPPRTPMTVIITDLTARGYKLSNNLGEYHIARRVAHV